MNGLLGETQAHRGHTERRVKDESNVNGIGLFRQRCEPNTA